ncbi:MAG: hypothetical protein V4510_12980 [bacterium]
MADPATQADLRAALAEAVEESEFPTDEKLAEEDEWDFSTEEVSAPAADDGSIPGKDDEEVVEADPEAAEAVQDPIPDVYFGVDLTGIPEEQARTIYESLQKQDTYIHKLQARLATEPEASSQEATSEPEVITDEALLQALGFDPEDWETQQLAPKILPLARTVVELEDRVDQLANIETTRAVETQWNGELNQLEETYGKLPFERVQVLKFAIEEGIASPFEAYFKLSAPAKREVESAVAAARQAAAKQAATGGVKPRSSANIGTSIDPKTTSLRDAVKQAMAETEKETGLKFKNIFSGRKVKTEG